jgi:hypothetical protein
MYVPKAAGLSDWSALLNFQPCLILANGAVTNIRLSFESLSMDKHCNIMFSPEPSFASGAGSSR